MTLKNFKEQSWQNLTAETYDLVTTISQWVSCHSKVGVPNFFSNQSWSILNFCAQVAASIHFFSLSSTTTCPFWVVLPSTRTTFVAKPLHAEISWRPWLNRRETRTTLRRLSLRSHGLSLHIWRRWRSRKSRRPAAGVVFFFRFDRRLLLFDFFLLFIFFFILFLLFHLLQGLRRCHLRTWTARLRSCQRWSAQVTSHRIVKRRGPPLLQKTVHGFQETDPLTAAGAGLRLGLLHCQTT